MDVSLEEWYHTCSLKEERKFKESPLSSSDVSFLASPMREISPPLGSFTLPIVSLGLSFLWGYFNFFVYFNF